MRSGKDELMALEWEQVIVDATDPVALGRWWADALDWVVVNDDPEEFEIRPAPISARESRHGSF
jgi:Glyoxalase-like domain